jgi:hypothetical protein
MQTKVCKACGIDKPLQEFYKHRTNKDGYRGICKQCWKNQCDKWLKDNPEFTQNYRNKKASVEKILVSEKECFRCHNIKKIDEFHKDRCSIDGHSVYCKQCKSDTDKEGWKKYRWERLPKNREYYKEHREEISNYRKTDEYKKITRETAKEWYHNRGGRESYIKHRMACPWESHYNNIKQRLYQKNSSAYKRGYKYYAGKGIQLLMTLKEIKELYVRDGAEFMKEPCIHRKESDGHYTFENCCFMETKDHRKLHAEMRKKPE